MFLCVIWVSFLFQLSPFQSLQGVFLTSPTLYEMSHFFQTLSFRFHDDSPQYWTPTLSQALCWAPSEKAKPRAWGILGNRGQRGLQATQLLPSGRQFCQSTHVSSYSFS